MTGPSRERRRRSRRRRRRLARWLAVFVLGALLFAAGVAVGEAIHDNPRPGVTTTNERTVTP